MADVLLEQFMAQAKAEFTRFMQEQMEENLHLFHVNMAKIRAQVLDNKRVNPQELYDRDPF